MTNDIFPSLSTTEQDALALIHAATTLSRARKSEDKTALTVALDKNLQLWTAIQTVISQKNHPMPAETKENLLKLGQFVVKTTLLDGCEASKKTLDTLENLNIQIAQGLMENIQLPALKENAGALISSSYALTDALESEDKTALTAALDENLKIWIGLKTLAETKKLLAAEELNENIKRLADFVTTKTFELSREDNLETLTTLININMQIAGGFLESLPLSTTEADALALLRSAQSMAEAKDTQNESGLVQALDENMQLWVGIQTLVSKESHPMAKEIKENLSRLAEFTVQKTFEIGSDTSNPTIDTLININLQISEGLLERINV